MAAAFVPGKSTREEARPVVALNANEEPSDRATEKRTGTSVPFSFECVNDELRCSRNSDLHSPAFVLAGALLALWQVTSLSRRFNG